MRVNTESSTKMAAAIAITTVVLAACTPTSAPEPSPTMSELPSPEPTESPEPEPEPCLDSGDQNDINLRLRGPGAEAVLCPGVIFELTGTVTFTAPDQKLYTEGHPTDDTRAVLRIVHPDVVQAVQARDYTGAEFTHVIVDGNRSELGYLEGEALVVGGGESRGQVFRWLRLIEPRGWSALHIAEGHGAPRPSCFDALVENNVIGPAGMPDHTWADGISFACADSVVRHNTIVDATDGGIVLFQAPGTVVEDNTIRAETRTALGGINMVDYGPYDGNYTGTIVRANVIDAAGAVIRIGLGMGNHVWGCRDLDERDADVEVYGATATGNTLQGAHMQYGFIADVVRDWTVTDNVSTATHSGVPVYDCHGVLPARPGPFLKHPTRASGVFQEEFVNGELELALWTIPEPLPE